MEVRRETERKREIERERGDYYDAFLFFVFVTEVGNGSNGIQLIEPRVGKVSTFKPQVGNL